MCVAVVLMFSFLFYILLCICSTGLAAGDSDRTQGVGASSAVAGFGKISAEGAHLAEQED